MTKYLHDRAVLRGDSGESEYFHDRAAFRGDSGESIRHKIKRANKIIRYAINSILFFLSGFLWAEKYPGTRGLNRKPIFNKYIKKSINKLAFKADTFQGTIRPEEVAQQSKIRWNGESDPRYIINMNKMGERRLRPIYVRR